MSATRYHLVRGLDKGLTVLRTLNATGEASSATIGTRTGLPRPTAHRLLETLVATGYVTQGRKRGTYRLTRLVRALSEGYRDDDWVSDVADPVLKDLSDQIVWPTDIATYEDGAMVIRTSTHHRSPMSIHGPITGTRFPLLGSSIGLAYLAFCPLAERRAILETLPDRGGISAAGAKRLLDATRKRGYGLRKAAGKFRTSSFSVPIMSGDHVLACLCVVWIDSALSVDVAIARYLPALTEAARRIETGCA